MSYHMEELKEAVHRGLGEMTATTNKLIEDTAKEFGKALADERKEREALEAKLNRLGLSTGGDMRGNDTALRGELEAFGAFAAKGDASKLLEMKAMSVGSDPNGGYLVLPALSNSMATKIFDLSPMKRLARVETIDSGDSWEEIIDKDEPDAEWVAEYQARNETGTPDVGKHTVRLHEIHASPKVTQKLLDTSQYDVGAWLEGKVANKFGRTEGVAFISGDGVGKPFGLLSGTPVTTGDATRAWGTLQYTATGVSGDFAASAKGDKLKDVLYSLRAPYRKGATWLMNSNTASQIDKFKDSQNNYIWSTGMTAGAPPSLLGYPVEFDENMPDVSAGTFPIAFGNFKLGYVVVELAGIRVLRDPFTAKPNVVFYTYKRVGGDISNSEAIKLLKTATS
jgi:HK97 family phage major capsid protein